MSIGSAISWSAMSDEGIVGWDRSSSTPVELGLHAVSAAASASSRPAKHRVFI
jgi:hypothetical protein